MKHLLAVITALTGIDSPMCRFWKRLLPEWCAAGSGGAAGASSSGTAPGPRQWPLAAVGTRDTPAFSPIEAEESASWELAVEEGMEIVVDTRSGTTSQRGPRREPRQRRRDTTDEIGIGIVPHLAAAALGRKRRFRKKETVLPQSTPPNMGFFAGDTNSEDSQ